MYKNRTVSVVMPCLNEEEGIKNVLSRMPSFVDETVVADNGSTDGTVRVATEMGAKVIHQNRRGYGSAYKAGIPGATSELVVTMDGDGSYPPEEIAALLDPIVEGKADFVSGTRFPLQKKSAMSTTSKIGNFGLTLAFNILFLKYIKDSQSGMWAFPHAEYGNFAPESEGMAYSQEIKARAMRAGKRFLEVPISYAPRIGTVKLAWLKDGVVNLLSLCWLLLCSGHTKRK